MNTRLTKASAHISKVILFACLALGCLCLPAIAAQPPFYTNVKNYGAVGDGVADDTQAIQRAIDAAVGVTNPTYAVYLPAGNYRITSSLNIHEYCNSLYLFGAGAYALVNPAPTRITWAGAAGGTMLNCPKSFGLHMSDLQLHGGDIAGVLVKVNSTIGWPSACWNLERLLLSNAATGIECGSSSDMCASDMTLIDVNFDHLSTGFHARAHQNVNYAFIRPTVGFCDVGLWFEKGGSVTCNLLSGSFVGTAVRIDAGDINDGNFYFNGVKIETYKWNGARTVLFDIKGYASTVYITGLCSSVIDLDENGAAPYTPLFRIGWRASVTIDSSIISGHNVAEINGADGDAPTWLQFNDCFFTAGDPRATISRSGNAGFSLHECKLDNGLIADYKLDPSLIAPETPTGLLATPASSTRINLTWKNVAGETGYEIERSPDGTSNWMRIATPAADVNVFADTGLTPDTTYYYHVRSLLGTNISWWSNVASATAHDLPLSAVLVTANPAAPQQVETPITLTALPTGGSNPEYRFSVGYQPTPSTWQWEEVRTYATTPTCIWTPHTAHLYTVLVQAREVGSTATYQVSGTRGYRVTAMPLTALNLVALPAAPQARNTAITLTATPTGGANPEYKFRAGYQDATGWHWEDIRAYAASPIVSWTPTEARLYTLVAQAREIGSPAPYQVYHTITYRVTIPPLSAVALTAFPASPQRATTPITLSAIPTGGDAVEYQFRVGYQDAMGWHWQVLQGYGTACTCTWTPAESRGYTLAVWARAVGSTKVYEVAGSLAYTVAPPPITAVTITAVPATPCRVLTPVSLNATTTGGWRVEYQFRAGYQDATGWHWTVIKNYNTTRYCTWTPDIPRTYSIVVYAREVGTPVVYDAYQAQGYRVTAQ